MNSFAGRISDTHISAFDWLVLGIVKLLIT